MQWQVPRKTILSKEQLEYFQGSKTYQDIISYIETLNTAVIGSKLTDDCHISPVSTAHLTNILVPLMMGKKLKKGVTAVLGILEKIAQIAKDIPPVDNAASRFGNPAFRTFYDKVSEVRREFFLDIQCICCIHIHSISRYRRLYMSYYPISLREVCRRSLSISMKLGAIERGLIMEVVWS